MSRVSRQRYRYTNPCGRSDGCKSEGDASPSAVLEFVGGDIKGVAPDHSLKGVEIKNDTISPTKKTVTLFKNLKSKLNLSSKLRKLILILLFGSVVALLGFFVLRAVGTNLGNKIV